MNFCPVPIGHQGRLLDPLWAELRVIAQKHRESSRVSYSPMTKTGMKAPQGTGMVVAKADIQNWGEDKETGARYQERRTRNALSAEAKCPLCAEALWEGERRKEKGPNPRTEKETEDYNSHSRPENLCNFPAVPVGGSLGTSKRDPSAWGLICSSVVEGTSCSLKWRSPQNSLLVGFICKGRRGCFDSST